MLGEPRFAAAARLVLGGGSNILFTKNFDGLVLKNSLRGIEILREDDRHVWVRAAAGEVWHELVMFCVERELAGLENLSLIPGQVGAAPMQNIGAYGVEMRETCESVEALAVHTGESVTFTNGECEFGYRDSVFKHRYKDQFLITARHLPVNNCHSSTSGTGRSKDAPGDGHQRLSLRAVSDAVSASGPRSFPDPKVIGNAGSFFKNPIIGHAVFERLHAEHPAMPHYPQRNGETKVPAGWLIEQCGWKGKVVGHTGVHARQALVLVNHGGATGSEVYTLALAIQQSVRDRFGIDLAPEVNWFERRPTGPSPRSLLSNGIPTAASSHHSGRFEIAVEQSNCAAKCRFGAGFLGPCASRDSARLHLASEQSQCV